MALLETDFGPALSSADDLSISRACDLWGAVRFSALAQTSVRSTTYAPLTATQVLLCVFDAIAKARTPGTSATASIAVTLPSAAGTINLKWAVRYPAADARGWQPRRGEIFIATSAETLDATLSTALPAATWTNYQPFDRERWCLERAALSLS